ncbi:MAG: polyprenyl synthetase family protein [Clostridiales bacterium]|nr:polyprenyl synthetase family protein [Clostridiales bacterium]
MDFKQTLRQNAERTEVLLKNLTNDFVKNQVNDAIKYSLLDGGKRLRPSLVFETAKLFDVYDNNIERIAMAIEMIHTYSLVHDDLPSMDNDDFRRGKPSCHKQFGEDVAVLAGDGLLNLAAETLLGGVCSQNYFDAIKFVFNCSGIFGMIGGQAIDISKNKINDFETLEFLTENKTAKLIVACVCATAIYCNADKKQKESLCEFAKNFGIAFQIADDLLDSESDENLSFTNLLGIDGAKKELKKYTNLALSALNDCFEKEKLAFFEQLLDFNMKRNH